MGQDMPKTIAHLTSSMSLQQENNIEASYKELIQFIKYDLTEKQIQFIKENVLKFISISYVKNICSLIIQRKQYNINFLRLTIIIKTGKKDIKFKALYIENIEIRIHEKDALQYYKNNEFDRSLSEWKKLESHPNMIDIFKPTYIYEKIGQVLVKLQRYKQAEEYLSEIKDTDQKYLIQKANRLLCIVYEKLGNKKKYQEALLKNINIFPKSQWTLTAYIQFLKTQKRNKETIFFYKEIIEIQGFTTKNFTSLMGMLYKLQMQEQANIYFQKLLKQIPQGKIDDIAIAQYYKKIKKTNKARALLQTSLTKQQNYIRYFMLWQIYSQNNEIQQAFDCFQKVMILKPKQFYSNLAIGKYFAKNQLYIAQFIQFYENHIQIWSQNNIQQYFQLGKKNLFYGQIKKAMEYFNKILQIFPQDPNAIFFLGQCQGLNQNYQKAIYYFEKCLKIVPQGDNCYYSMALIYHINLKNIQKAKELLEKAISINNNAAYFHYELGLIYLEEFNYIKALQFFTTCAKINPSEGVVFMLISQIYIKLYSKQKALELINNFNHQGIQDSSYFYQIANVLYELEDYKAAKTNFQLSIDLNDEKKSSLFMLGITQLFMGNYTQSQILIKESLQQQKLEVRYYVAREGYIAIALIKQNKYQESLQLLSQIVIKYDRLKQLYYIIAKNIFYLRQLQNTNGLNINIDEQQDKIKQLIQVDQDPQRIIIKRMYFHRGMNQYSRFYSEFKNVLGHLKKQLKYNEEQGKEKINRFMQEIISEINFFKKIFQEKDLFILLSILYRNIGNMMKAEASFNKLFNQKDLSTYPIKQLQRLFQQNLHTIHKQCEDYFVFLIEFILQQFLQKNFYHFIECYRYIETVHKNIAHNEDINHWVYSKREIAIQIFRLVIEQVKHKNGYILINPSNKFYDVQSISKQEIKQSINKVKIEGEGDLLLENIFYLFSSIQTPFMKQVMNQSIFQQDRAILQCYLREKYVKSNISTQTTSTEKNYAQLEEQKEKEKEKAQQSLVEKCFFYILSNYNLNQVLIVLFKQLYSYCIFQPQLQQQFLQISKRFKLKEYDMNQMPTILYKFFENRSRIKPKEVQLSILGTNSKSISLQSSFLFADYDHLGQSKYAQNKGQGQSSKLMKLKNKTRSAAMLSLIGQETNIYYQNLFQRSFDKSSRQQNIQQEQIYSKDSFKKSVQHSQSVFILGKSQL